MTWNDDRKEFFNESFDNMVDIIVDLREKLEASQEKVESQRELIDELIEQKDELIDTIDRLNKQISETEDD